MRRLRAHPVPVTAATLLLGRLGSLSTGSLLSLHAGLRATQPPRHVGGPRAGRGMLAAYSPIGSAGRRSASPTQCCLRGHRVRGPLPGAACGSERRSSLRLTWRPGLGGRSWRNRGSSAATWRRMLGIAKTVTNMRLLELSDPSHPPGVAPGKAPGTYRLSHRLQHRGQCSEGHRAKRSARPRRRSLRHRKMHALTSSWRPGGSREPP